MRIDVDRGGVVLVLQEGLHRAVDFLDQIRHAAREFGLPALVVERELDHRFRGDAAFGMRTRREFVARGADAVAGGEQPLDRGHAVIAPRPFLGRARNVGRPGNPDAGASRMGAEQVGLGRHDLRRLLVRLDVLAGPDAALRDGHVQEVFHASASRCLTSFGVIFSASFAIAAGVSIMIGPRPSFISLIMM